MKRSKWVLYTVGLGASPLLARFLLAYLLAPTHKMQAVSVTDVIGFGLLLCVASITLLEYGGAADQSWNGKHLALAVLNVIFLVIAFAASCVLESGTQLLSAQPDPIVKVTVLSALLTMGALIQNYAVSDRLEKTSSPGGV